MTRNMSGLIAAGILAIGIALGGVGASVARDNATPDMADHMRGMTSMMSMMGGSMGDMGSMMGGSMGDMGSMMGGSMGDMGSMMGGGSPMTPDASVGPDASMSPGEHKSHHVSPSPEATR